MRTMESVVYAAGLKSEADPRYLRAALAWLTNKAGWRQLHVIEQMDVPLEALTDDQLQRIADGESPVAFLADGVDCVAGAGAGGAAPTGGA